MRILSYDCDEVAAACTGPSGRCGQVHGASRVRRDDRRPPGSRHQAVPSQHSPDTTSEKFLSSASSQAILQSAGTEIESLTELMTPLVRSDKYFVSFSTCNPTTCSHWLTQSENEADIYYLFIIG